MAVALKECFFLYVNIVFSYLWSSSSTFRHIFELSGTVRSIEKCLDIGLGSIPPVEMCFISVPNGGMPM